MRRPLPASSADAWSRLIGGRHGEEACTGHTETYTPFPTKAGPRAARDKLLKAEIALRRQVETVAQCAVSARRRAEGRLCFRQAAERLHVRAVYWRQEHIARMLHVRADMKSACARTSILDGLDGQAPHVTQRPNMVSSPSRRSSGSGNLRRAGLAKPAIAVVGRQHYNHDYHGETEAARRSRP
jgi:predicted dithiol-disulfide oxidoreductase (DUF899 family)